jgi:predicted RNase H-like HicB family nuclease
MPASAALDTIQISAGGDYPLRTLVVTRAILLDRPAIQGIENTAVFEAYLHLLSCGCQFRASIEPLRKPNDVGFAEDNCFVAIVPQLAGCSAVGSSMEEAVPEVQDAITAWIGAAKKAGNPVPTPLILARAEQALTLPRRRP